MRANLKKKQPLLSSNLSAKRFAKWNKNKLNGVSNLYP